MTPVLSDQGAAPSSRRSNPDVRAPAGAVGLDDLLNCGLALEEDWQALSAATRREVEECSDPRRQRALLLQHGLLTEYQLSRIESGSTFGLMLGNYRVLDSLGAGGMGNVYRAEHVLLRRPVAVKVLHSAHAHDPHLLHRFHREVRAVGRLQHPNVVAALDAGSAASPDGHSTTLHYYVMEYVPGQDLERLVKAQGILPVASACDIIFQVASALAEAHKHELVHRDIKPSNIQVTPDGQAKLLDFGLARFLCDRVTIPGLAMGSLGYMAPEQAIDASGVDIRADLYALGGTLLWCLTGQAPFRQGENVVTQLIQRQSQLPPAMGGNQTSVPPALWSLVKRMMASAPADRYQTPQHVMDALLPFLKPEMRDDVRERQSAACTPASSEPSPGGPRIHQILIVDDDPDVREMCAALLKSETLRCDEAVDGMAALEATRTRRYDLILLDIDMPRMNGREVLTRLRQTPPSAHLKIILFSGRESGDDMAELLQAGADDYLPKPFSVVQFKARVNAALRFKDLQDRSDLLNQRLLASNEKLEANLNLRDINVVQIRNGLVLALAKLVEYRDSESGQHLIRMQRYCECLATEAAKRPPFNQQIDDNFIEMIVGCVPLHDIGKAIVPDHILLKPGKLDAVEREIIQRHTVVARETLAAVTLQQGLAPAFLQMAMDIACHHHERYDGQGYPDQLACDDIPLAARIVALADVYDALRSRRVYKPSLSHAAAVQLITKVSEGQFDPNLITVFARCADQFGRIFTEFPA